MVISSAIVKCLTEAEDTLSGQLEQIEGLSVEKVHNGDIIIVLESSSVDQALLTIEREITPLQGVLGTYPVYINMEI